MRLLSAWSAPVHILGCANGGFPLEKMGCQSKSQRGDHHPRAKKPQLKAPAAPKVDSRTSLQKPETAKYPNPGVTCKKHKEAFWRHMGGNHIRPKKHRPWRTSPKSPPFFSQSKLTFKSLPKIRYGSPNILPEKWLKQKLVLFLWLTFAK